MIVKMYGVQVAEREPVSLSTMAANRKSLAFLTSVRLKTTYRAESRRNLARAAVPLAAWKTQ